LKWVKSIIPFFFVAAISNDLADLFYDKGMRDSCLRYIHQCLSLSQRYHYKVFEMSSSGFLSDLYDSLSTDSTLKYMKIYIAAKDEVYSKEKIKQFQAASIEEEKKERDLENAKTEYENRLKMYAIIVVAVVFLVIAFILFRNNRQKQKANILLEHQKEKIEHTLTELKATQSQLIQSEKMASLGELTAGIAHEIQNPLNFVNNFSEVNTELIDEMQQEMDKGNLDEAKVIAKDIKENEQKINHHGKRADSIVKGMLQHSRSSSGVKEPTDINALADEYLRLAYHGLRAKDKSFNATMKTDFDETIGKINVIPQDIGRVILNLIINAFYVVDEKQKRLANSQQPTALHYEPTVTVSTKKTNGKVEINVKDNGNGIPQKVVDKIFHPFFTTKPAGQGTGLGLSLSYDIITKGHGGDIKVNTTENVGTEFIVVLPISNG
jgi:two-component system, NtrC family, sensor kinase